MLDAYQQTGDGQNAWKSLINYCEGESGKTRRKQECYGAISTAAYPGTSKTFDFSTYLAIVNVLSM